MGANILLHGYRETVCPLIFFAIPSDVIHVLPVCYHQRQSGRHHDLCAKSKRGEAKSGGKYEQLRVHYDAGGAKLAYSCGYGGAGDSLFGLMLSSCHTRLASVFGFRNAFVSQS